MSGKVGRHFLCQARYVQTPYLSVHWRVMELGIAYGHVAAGDVLVVMEKERKEENVASV